MSYSQIEAKIREFSEEYGSNSVAVFCTASIVSGFEVNTPKIIDSGVNFLPEALQDGEEYQFRVRVFGGIKTEFQTSSVQEFFAYLRVHSIETRIILTPYFSPWEATTNAPFVCREVICECEFVLSTNEILRGDAKSDFSLPSDERFLIAEQISKLQSKMIEGDCYLANATCRMSLSVESEEFSAERFFRLWQADPSRFGAYFASGDRAVMSFSPERFLKVRGRLILTEPIKGTVSCSGCVPSGSDAERLWSSRKEIQEHTMVVDLLRNDLNMVCEPGTVHVWRPFFAAVAGKLLQMQSWVFGTKRAELELADVLRAVLPAGSVSGTPKWRVCEYIRDYENTPRDWYSGVLGVENSSGEFDSILLIRSLFLCNNRVTFGVGAGITTLSDVELEVGEFEVKARSFLSRFKL